MGKLTGHRGQRLAGQSQCENFNKNITVGDFDRCSALTGCNLRGIPWRAEAHWPITVREFPVGDLIAVPLTGSNLRGSPAIYSIYVSWPIFLKVTNFISSCKIIHLIKSDNQFLFISQNNKIAEAPSDPLRNLPDKNVSEEKRKRKVGIRRWLEMHVGKLAGHAATACIM